MMKLSVVIPTFNRRELLLQTLPTVLDQTFPASEYEVIVVVDGSTDGTASALRHINSPVRIVVIEQDNRGQAAANNTGLRVATGELVLLLDDDLFCERSLIAEHVAAHTGRDYLVFGPVLVAPQSPETLATKWLRSITGAWLSRLERDGVRWPDDAIMMANSSIRRDTLVAMGGFDESFFRALEDVELGRRLWKAGLLFRYCPAAVTRQLYLKTTDDVVLHDAPMYGTNDVLLCRTHPEYRMHSVFAGFTSGTWLKRKIRELSVRLPLPIDPLLKLAERSARISSGLGMRIFNARQRLSMYRSLVRASGGWKRFERDSAKALPVLLYPRIGPVRPGEARSLTVEPIRFKKQMDWLRRNGYTAIRTSDWLGYCIDGNPLPERPVMLTFDAAYEDLAEYAFPVLKDNGFTATVFVVTGEVGGSDPRDQRYGSAVIRYMDADQIRHWARLGLEFGAHARTRTDLTKLSASGLDKEVAGSGSDLAEISGAVPLSFAYPLGNYNETVRSSVEKVFKLAFTCDEGLNMLGTGPHLLRRTMVQPGDTLPEFAMRVKFGFNPVEKLVARVWHRSTRK
jgi:GT2 family glycosyltransferase